MGSEPMSARQRGAIFAIASKTGIDTDTLHDIVQRTTGAQSIAALDKWQAILVIDALKRQAGGDRPLGHATEGQRRYIFSLCRRLGWVEENDSIDIKRLEGFARRIGPEKLNWIRPDDARRLIEALKSMAEGGRGERKAKDA